MSQRKSRSASSDPWAGTPPVPARAVAALSRLSAVMRSASWQLASKSGLTPTQIEILLLLQARQGGLRLSLIAQQLSTSAATASDAVAALEAKGLVFKARDAQDARALAVVATAAGLDMAVQANQANGFVASAIDGLPEPEQGELLRLLLLTIGHLQGAAQFPDLRTCLTCKHFEPGRDPGSATPHFCRLVNAPLSVALIRVDCAEHEVAEPTELGRNWDALAQQS